MNELQTLNELTQTREDITTAFLNSLDVKPVTKETYKKALRSFLTWLEQTGRNGNSREEILAYKAYLMETYEANTVSAYLTAVRSFYRYLEAVKLFPNIAAGIKGAKGSKGHKRDTLTKEQAKEVLNGIDRSTLEGKRDYCLVNLLLRTGIRTIEAVRADYEDLRQEGGQMLLYIQGKGQDTKSDFVILTPATLEPIREYIEATGGRKSKQAIFISHSNRSKGERLTTRSIRGIVKKAMNGADINSSRLTAHSLRHTAVTFSLLNGATLQEAQAMARHSNINTTLIYAHNIQRLASAPERKIDSYLDN